MFWYSWHATNEARLLRKMLRQGGRCNTGKVFSYPNNFIFTILRVLMQGPQSPDTSVPMAAVTMSSATPIRTVYAPTLIRLLGLDLLWS